MARIDPKNDELGMMENIFRGVRPIGSSENETIEPNADASSAPPKAVPADESIEPVGTSGVKPDSTEAAPFPTDPTATTHRQ